MQVTQFVGICAVVDLLRLEQLLHRTRHVRHIRHEQIALFVIQFVEVVNMLVVRHKATAMIGLLFEQERTRHAQVTDLNHEIVQGLIVGAIETIFGV